MRTSLLFVALALLGVSAVVNAQTAFFQYPQSRVRVQHPMTLIEEQTDQPGTVRGGQEYRGAGHGAIAAPGYRP
jgi:hypothetical protein